MTCNSRTINSSLEPYELYGPKAKFTDSYSAGILDNPPYSLKREEKTHNKRGMIRDNIRLRDNEDFQFS